MTWKFTTNLLVLAADDATGKFWVALKDLGVTNTALVVMGTGDGIATFQNTGDTAGPFDVLTGGATVWNSGVANEFSNTGAWMRLREVGSTREFVVRRHTSASVAFEDDLSVAFSPTGFDDTGIATANLPPTASAGDEQFLYGTGVGSFVQAGPLYNADTMLQIGIEDTAQGGVYPWFLVARTASTGVMMACLTYEALEGGIVGDPQPWIIMKMTTPPTSLVFGITENRFSTYYDYGGAGEAWLSSRLNLGASPLGLIDGASQRLWPGQVPPQVDGNARDFPIFVGRVQLSAFRGQCRNLKWKGTDSRNYPDTLDLATVNARVYFDDMLFPWEQNTVPL